jgi:hypothetical protein
MRKVILWASVAVCIPAFAEKKENDWSLPTGQLKHVFVCKESAKSTELLRVYSDGTYEHINYENLSKSKHEVSRNVGSYTVKSGKINFLKPDQLQFSGKFKYGEFVYNGKLYQNRFIKLFNKSKEALTSTEDERFYKPFFIQLNEDLLVSNADAAKFISLKDVMTFVTRQAKTEREQYNSIVDYLSKTLSHDLESPKSTFQEVKSVEEMLAGGKRTAKAEGYARALKHCLALVSIKSRVVSGNYRSDIRHLSGLGEEHVWNVIELSESSVLIDLFLADQTTELNTTWVNIDPKAMIYSHFPNRPQDQLLDRPVSMDDFQQFPVLIPLSSVASFDLLPLQSVNSGQKEFKFKVKGVHNFSLDQMPSACFNTRYTMEEPVNNFSRSKKIAGVSIKIVGDSTQVTIPLEDGLNYITMIMDESVKCSFLVKQGGDQANYLDYVKNVEVAYADPYLRAVLACVKLDKLSSLKQVLGAHPDPILTYDGKLALDAKQLKVLKQWNGKLTELTVLNQEIETVDEDGESSSYTQTEHFIAIPDGPKFFLERIDMQYFITRIEWP